MIDFQLNPRLVSNCVVQFSDFGLVFCRSLENKRAYAITFHVLNIRFANFANF